MLDRLATATGLLQWHERQMRQGLTILMYHRILPLAQCRQYPLASLVIPTEAFRQQMQWLAGHCRVLPVREALAQLAGGVPYKRPLVAVTFDDGYADNFELAAPILEEQGLRGTFFVTSDFVAQGEPLWYDRATAAWPQLTEAERRDFLSGLPGAGQSIPNQSEGADLPAWMAGLKQMEPEKRLALVHRTQKRAKNLDLEPFRPMTPEQLALLHRRGHEIASHTVSHPILPQLDDDQLRRELEESAAKLSNWIDYKIVGFCYPNGDFNIRVEKAVRTAGYDYACTTRSGLNRIGCSPTRLARLSITIQRTTSAEGGHDPLGYRAELCRLRERWR